MLQVAPRFLDAILSSHMNNIWQPILWNRRMRIVKFSHGCFQFVSADAVARKDDLQRPPVYEWVGNPNSFPVKITSVLWNRSDVLYRLAELRGIQIGLDRGNGERSINTGERFTASIEVVEIELWAGISINDDIELPGLFSFLVEKKATKIDVASRGQMRPKEFKVKLFSGDSNISRIREDGSCIGFTTQDGSNAIVVAIKSVEKRSGHFTVPLERAGWHARRLCEGRG